VKSENAARSTKPEGFLPLAVGLAAVWWLSIRMLWTDWEIDPQYSYGFLVPILCVALFLQRWRDRPAPEPPRNLRPNALLALPPLLFLTGIQPFFEANPEWRIPGMFGALSAVALTLILIHALGGRSWLRHFFFPAAFFLIAVPWPRNAEEALMGFLMEKNAIAALEVLHWCGYEAVRRGNLIALPTGLLGVEEACSGVRSLQSGLMASLFFGEIFRFGLFARGALVFAALGFAVIGNFFRATALSIAASTAGLGAVDKWHDTAGFAALAFTLGALWIVAYWWHQHRIRKSALANLPEPAPPPPVSFPIRQAAFAALALAVMSLAGTEVWYRLHERNAPPPAGWTIREGTVGSSPVQVPDRTRRILFFPEGFSERFRDSEGRRWQFFYFRWPAGRTALQAINIHNPQTCLGSIGMELVRQLPLVEIRARGMVLPFNVYVFTDQGRPVLVFHSIIADRQQGSHDAPTMESSSGNTSMSGRWDSVASGMRNRGQRLLEAAVWGTDNVFEASASLQRFLEQAIEAGDPSPKP
jgi:exosortase